MKNNLFKIFIFLVSIFLFVCDFNINPTISKNIVEIDIDLPFVEIREDEEEKYINVKNSDIYKNDHYRFNLLIDNQKVPLTEFQYLQFAGTKTVPRGYIFVLGDNFLYSVDSRDYGFVSTKSIKGKAIIYE